MKSYAIRQWKTVSLLRLNKTSVLITVAYITTAGSASDETKILFNL
jgi:hypothetical protein